MASEANTIRYVFQVEPCPAPRMTRRDKWKKRPCVMRYFAFRDEIRLQMRRVGLVPPKSDFHITFYVGMPESWSRKKKDEMDGQPHQVRFDLDNAMKAWMDSVFEEDGCVWDFRATKRWSSNPRIEIVVPDLENQA